MRIGIDCRTILNPDAGEKAGVAHYTYHLVKNLLRQDKLDEFILFFDHRAQNIVKEFLEPNTQIRFFTFSKYKKYLPFVYSHLLSASTLASEKLDLYHSPANVVPAGISGRFVVTVHDLAIYRHRDMFPAGQGFSVKYLVPRTINRAQKIIAVSNSTKSDVEKFFHIPADRVAVIYEGVDHGRFSQARANLPLSEEFKKRYKLHRKYLLFVGTLEPRKNLIRLLEAYYKVVSARPDIRKEYQLVLAGSPGWLYQEIYEEVKNRELTGDVVFPGYVAALDKPALFAGAECFLFPSIYEGFGLPVLEAMAAGVPVITSNVSSLPEIAGDAALLIDPFDTDGMAKAIIQLITDADFRLDLGRRGRKRADDFSWEKCARETLGVYKQAVSRV